MARCTVAKTVDSTPRRIEPRCPGQVAGNNLPVSRGPAVGGFGEVGRPAPNSGHSIFCALPCAILHEGDRIVFSRLYNSHQRTMPLVWHVRDTISQASLRSPCTWQPTWRCDPGGPRTVPAWLSPADAWRHIGNLCRSVAAADPLAAVCPMSLF